MRIRQWLFALCFLISILCSGCQFKMPLNERDAAPISFRVLAEIKTEQETYKAVCTFLDAQSVEIVFKEPHNLESLTIVQTKTDCTIDFLGLHQEAKAPYLAKQSFLHQIFLAYMALQDENHYVLKHGEELSYYIGKMPDAFQFTWTRNKKTNEFLSLEIPQAKLICTFTNMTIL